MTTLILRRCELNSNDLSSLAQAKVKGYVPLLKHLDITWNKLSILELKCLFDGPCYWSELLTLGISQAFNYDEDDQLIDYMNEIVSRGYLSSLTKLEINHFGRSNVLWKSLEKLVLFKCEKYALRNIADAVRSGFLPELIHYVFGILRDTMLRLSGHCLNLVYRATILYP